MAPLFPSPFRLEKEPVRDRRKSRGEQRREGLRKVLKRRRPWPGQSPPWSSLVWGLGTRQHQGFSRKQQGGWLLVATVHTLWFSTMFFYCSKPHRISCQACPDQGAVQSCGCIFQHGARPLLSPCFHHSSPFVFLLSLLCSLW